MNDWSDITADELAAEDRAQRRRLRPHFCMTCLGRTGPGSPCAEPEDEPQTEEQENE